MWSAATYRPDPLVVAGSAWARRKGIPNHQISTHQFGSGDTAHVHVVNHMFDHAQIAATVVPGDRGVAARVTEGSRCPICQPRRYCLTFTSPTGGSQAFAGTWQEVCDRAHLALKLHGVDIAVTDEAGVDVTFDVPAFAELATT